MKTKKGLALVIAKADYSSQGISEFLFLAIGKLCPDTRAVFLFPYGLFAYGVSKSSKLVKFVRNSMM